MKNCEDLQLKTKEEIIALFKQQQEKITQQAEQINNLHHQLKLAIQARYGKKSEKLSAHENPQHNLFDEAALPNDVNAITEQNEAITIASHARKKTGRKSLPTTLPRKQVIHDLPEADKVCECGCKLTHIADETSEQLEIIPAQVYVVENIRRKYACKTCELTIKTAKAPTQIIPKSIATPSLLAHVAVAKIDDHLPLYRQEEIFNRSGIAIPRMTLSLWLIRLGEAVQPLINLMHDIINDYDIAYADETPVQVLKEKNRSASQKSFMWLFIGGPPEKRCHLYHYAKTRASSVPYHVLDSFCGYLHSDGYSGYQTLFATKPIKGVGCFAHVRRKFIEITKIAPTKGLAQEAVDSIAKLYGIEKYMKENHFPAEVIKSYRLEKAKPILDDFYQWLSTHKPKVPPKSPIGTAINYALKQWRYLNTYLQDGRLEIDNNRSERAIKPFVIGRKNWLFMGNEKGATAMTHLYSLIETAKVHGLNPFDYLRFIFWQLPLANTIDDYETLLPHHCGHLKNNNSLNPA